MKNDILSIIEDSRSLNPKLFSLIRMQIMSNLVDLGQDGSTYRELKAVLAIGDGALFSNLKALESMGYVRSSEVTIEGKRLGSYNITNEGRNAWDQIRKWLMKMLECGSDGR